MLMMTVIETSVTSSSKRVEKCFCGLFSRAICEQLKRLGFASREHIQYNFKMYAECTAIHF